MIVSTHSEVEALRQAVYANGEAALAAVRKFSVQEDAIRFFARVKFEKMGLDPVSGKAMNLIEQINQTYSSLVVLAGADDLLARYPGKRFVLQLGASAGFDIRSEDGEVAAECFAVTTVDSNGKLRRDSRKLMESDGPKFRHAYFYADADSPEKLARLFARYPDVHFTRITQF